jgi:hypothetical protein
MPWTDAEWEIIQACQDQTGHGYAAHAHTWSNHSMRFEPALCTDCRKLLDELKSDA